MCAKPVTFFLAVPKFFVCQTKNLPQQPPTTDLKFSYQTQKFCLGQGDKYGVSFQFPEEFPVKTMKRKTDEEGSEMDVDDEQKIEQNDSIDEDDVDESDDDENVEQEEGGGTLRVEKRGDTPFLDSFYGLSSADGKERAQAAQIMLHHCLVGPNANTKDASYAFRRLLNGICSGRACARQGNASALASFLKISFHLGKMEEIRSHSEAGKDVDDKSILSYVRDRLIASTDPSQTTGKKKGSEERDFQFGRLFGILGIVRSTILLPKDDGDYNVSDIIEVSSELISDLADLFWLKKWMREPAAHGISIILNSFYSVCNKKDAKKVVKHLVEKVVIPKILFPEGNGDESDATRLALLENYSAEQIAIAAHIQSHVQHHSSTLPFPLDKAVLSTDNLPVLAQALSETSVVVQPRTHFAWDTIWAYLTEDEDSSSKTVGVHKKLRPRSPVGSDSALDVLDAVVRTVVCAKLLRLEKDGGGSGASATHERRSLALCIVKHLCGVTFGSSLSGPMQIVLESEALEHHVLTQDLVRTLFIDVICAGTQKKQSSHLLKPLALQVLQSITDGVTESSLGNDGNRRMAVVRALSNCEVRFDARTKTSTVSELLMFGAREDGKPSPDQIQAWNEYIGYLEKQIVAKSAAIKGQASSAEATGYVELLYTAAKSILRVEASKGDSDTKDLQDFKQSMIHRVQNFFMVCGFFKCDGVAAKGGKKTKKKAKKGGNSGDHPILSPASVLRDAGAMPYSVRTVVSARFFSLVADYVNYATHNVSESEKTAKLTKDTRMLEILSDLCDSLKVLEAAGAVRFSSIPIKEDEEADDSDPEKLVAEIRKRVIDLTASVESTPGDSLLESQRRCATGTAALALSIYLHRLNCGSPDDMMENDDPDADNDEDEEEITNAIDELNNVLDGFIDKKDEAQNPLQGLAGSCANILSSPIGSGNLGRASSPKLVREAVKFAWLGGLSLAAAMASDTSSLLNSAVIKLLLGAIGAANEDPMDEDEADEEGESDDDSDSDENSDNEDVFSKAAGVIRDDDDDMDTDKPENEENKEQESDDPDSDLEIDPSKLQSMLEDSDAEIDVGELEHHEGADAALAKLIQLRQENRKASQQAREKVEISNQLRCTFLVELMFLRPENWNNLFRSDVILGLLLPMLKHRLEIEKSLEKAREQASFNPTTGEKAALVDRFTNLLKSKLCKMRLAATPASASVDISEYASSLASELMEQAKRRGSKEHSSCCSSGLIFVLRAIPSAKDMISSAGIYAGALEEWSSKRTTRLHGSLFDDFITHMPRCDIFVVCMTKALIFVSYFVG
jgi:hypothetical protein